MSVTIAALTHQGLGRPVEGEGFYPRTLPGEVIEPGAEGAIRILTPSPDRVSPPCRHFKSCGGCALQHASDDFVAGFKQGVVVQALKARGLEPPLRPIATSPARSRRRAKLAGRRTKAGAMVGFHARASHLLIDIPDCHLLTPALMAARPGLERLVTLAASRKAEVDLTVTDSLAGLDVVVGTERELTGALRIDLAALAQAEGFARLGWNDETVVTIAAPAQRMGTAEVVPPPGAFLQATAHGEAVLREAVLEITDGARRVVDLFAGCGTFALPLAARAEVHAVEGDAAMLDALDRGWRRAPQLRRVTTEARDLFRRPLEPDEVQRFDAAVIDPPRAGAEAQVARLAEAGLKVIAMVSCNPVTFARDAQALVAAGYSLDWVQAVDQFRWSAHVEIVAAFLKS